MRNIQKIISFTMVSLAACNATSSEFNEAASDDENMRLAIEHSLVFQDNDEEWQDVALFAYDQDDEEQNIELVLAMSMIPAEVVGKDLAFDRVDDEKSAEKQVKKNEDFVDDSDHSVEGDPYYNEYVRLLSSSIQKLMSEKSKLILDCENEDLGFPSQVDGVLPEINNQILQFKSLAPYSSDELFQAFQNQFPHISEIVLRTRANHIYNHFEQREKDILLWLEGQEIHLFDPSQKSGKQMAIEHFLKNNPKYSQLTKSYLERVWDSFL